MTAQEKINENYLAMPGSKLINGKVIMSDGFNMTDAELDEKIKYMEYSDDLGSLNEGTVSVNAVKWLVIYKSITSSITIE